MGLQKQAKTLSKIQIKLVGDYLTTTLTETPSCFTYLSMQVYVQLRLPN